jgi:hypothetical protein
MHSLACDRVAQCHGQRCVKPTAGNERTLPV